MNHVHTFESFLNESLNESSDYQYIVDLILNAQPAYDVYYNDSWNVVNVGGTGYDKGDLVAKFKAKPGSSSDIRAAFYRAAQTPEETKKQVEKLSNGKIEVDIKSNKMVIYKFK